MKIAIDNRNTDIRYVDKANLHNANNDEVIKFINCGDRNNSSVIINVIAGYYSLNKTESVILKYIMFNYDIVYYKKVVNVISIITGKSTSTIDRAISNLKTKGLIYITINNEIKVSSSIKVDINKVNNAKFLVIELNPDVTSNGVSI